MFERLLTNKMFTLSAMCLAVSAFVILWNLPKVASAVFVPGISGDTTHEILETALGHHQEDSKLYRDRFKGRSIFFTPPAPKPPAQPPTQVAEREPEPEPPPPPPTIPDKYGGPEILALLGDQVHLAGPKILKLGEKDESIGLTVLEYVPPWSVKVEWLKKPGNYAPGTYVVEMFQRDYDAVFSKESADEPTISGLTQAEDHAAVVEPLSSPRDRRGERQNADRENRGAD